jgi:hypothetical protein
MTGRGRGFCVLKVPREPNAPVAGIIGRIGQPVGGTSALGTQLAQLQRDTRRIEAMLTAVRSRIVALEASRTPTGMGSTR